MQFLLALSRVFFSLAYYYCIQCNSSHIPNGLRQSQNGRDTPHIQHHKKPYVRKLKKKTRKGTDDL